MFSGGMERDSSMKWVKNSAFLDVSRKFTLDFPEISLSGRHQMLWKVTTNRISDSFKWNSLEFAVNIHSQYVSKVIGY